METKNQNNMNVETQNTLNTIKKWIMFIGIASIPFYLIMLYKLHMLLSGEVFMRTI
jgi:hypothetical protein